MSVNKKEERITVFDGLQIYKTGRSRFYQARVYVGNKKYRVISTGEELKTNAKKYATDLFFKLKEDGELSNKNMLFKFYADKFLEIAHLRSDKTRSKRYGSDAQKILDQEDGVNSFFAKMNIRDVTTAKIREYFERLNSTRDKPLAYSTLNSHANVIRQICKLAYEDRVITDIPITPEIKKHKKDNPRPSFTDEQYKLFLKTFRQLIDDKVQYKGRTISMHDYYCALFIVHTFQRPIISELFSNKIEDIEIKDNPKRLQIKIYDGKTGYRDTHSMETAIEFFEKLKKQYSYKKNDYLFYPHFKRRETAQTYFREYFNLVLDKCNLKNVENMFDENNKPVKRVPYSLRHYAIQVRLRKSKGKINLVNFAKNIGTSVQILERYYLRDLDMDEELIKNLQTF